MKTTKPAIEHFIANMARYAENVLELKRLYDAEIDDLTASELKEEIYSSWLSLRIGQAAFRTQFFGSDEDVSHRLVLNTVFAKFNRDWLETHVSNSWIILLADDAERDVFLREFTGLEEKLPSDRIMTIDQLLDKEHPVKFDSIDFLVAVTDAKSRFTHLIQNGQIYEWLTDVNSVDVTNTHVIHMQQ